MTAGLVNVSGDAGHRYSRSDDHVSELGKQVVTGAAGTLPAVQALHAYERLRGFAHLFGQLEQPDLGRDITVIVMQAPYLLPHSFFLHESRRVLRTQIRYRAVPPGNPARRPVRPAPSLAQETWWATAAHLAGSAHGATSASSARARSQRVPRHRLRTGSLRGPLPA